MHAVHSRNSYHAHMSESRLEPELLRTFLAVVRHSNLTRAAADLFVTQSAVTRRIGRLERDLGVPVFERLGKTLHLTHAGESLAREAPSFIGGVDRLLERIRAHRSASTGRLRVGASTTPGLYLLPPVVRSFRERFPDVEFAYGVENSLHIEERIVRNELDLGFVGAHLSHASLRLRALLDDEIVWYASEAHPLVRRRSVTGRDLAPETCVVREPGSATRTLVDAWLKRSRVRLTTTIQMGCPESAKTLVRAGLGVSYLSAWGLRGDGGIGLRRLDLDGGRLSRPVFLALHADKHLSPPMQAFLRLAGEALGLRGLLDAARG